MLGLERRRLPGSLCGAPPACGAPVPGRPDDATGYTAATHSAPPPARGGVWWCRSSRRRGDHGIDHHLTPGPPVVRVVRDGADDAVHSGHVAITDGSGAVIAAHGDPSVVIYPRSAVKPFQAAASLHLIAQRLPSAETAVMAASHVGGHPQQDAVRRLLARAQLTPGALRCPPALPVDAGMLGRHLEPTPLAHNCSGKHAGFLLASVAVGADPRQHLRPDAPVQQMVRTWLHDCCGTLLGPGVDGCGAPAWRVSLGALARGFAHLVSAAGPLATVAAAMRGHPDLVGGDGIVDTELMRAEPAIIAKRGAEGVLAMVISNRADPIGVAIKVSDGAARALGPIAVAVLDRLGLRGAASVATPVVLGGGEPRGAVEISADLDAALADLE